MKNTLCVSLFVGVMGLLAACGTTDETIPPPEAGHEATPPDACNGSMNDAPVDSDPDAAPDSMPAAPTHRCGSV